MTLQDLLRANRSYRRFEPDHLLDEKTLVELVELTRLCPSAANRQPLKYVVSWRPEQNARIFPHLRWAAALTGWAGPGEGERPAAYIVILGDTEISRKIDWDVGIVAQSMLLAAAERGLGGCMIGSLDHQALRREMNIPDRFEINLVIALGKPTETVVLEDAAPDQVPYWRDADGIHHVPKRPLDEILLRSTGDDTVWRRGNAPGSE